MFEDVHPGTRRNVDVSYPRKTAKHRGKMHIANPLVHCPCCYSNLIQCEWWRPVGRERMLVERRCPECGYGDELELARSVADVLMEHANEMGDCLEELADELESVDELRLSR